MKDNVLYNRNEQKIKSMGIASDGQIECPHCNRWMDRVIRCDEYSAIVIGHQSFSLTERRAMGDWERGDVDFGDQINNWYECGNCGYELPSVVADMVRDRLSGATD